MQRAVQRKTRGRTQRAVETAAHVVLAVGADRHVDREHERLEPGARAAFDEFGDGSGFTRQVGLEPRGAPGLLHVFEPRQRRAAHDHWNVGLCRGSRKYDIALVGGHRTAAHRREAERRRVFLAEERRFRRAPGNVHQRARHESIVVECSAVSAQRRIGFGAAGYIAVHRPRQIAARWRFEILQRKHHAQFARQFLVDFGARAAVTYGLVGV